jgi:nitrogen PTS system EIIA component
MEQSPFMDVDEAARYLRASKAGIYRWVETGELKASRVGRLLRFRRTDLDEFVERCTKAAQSA